MTLSDRLKAWREKKGWGLRDLARASGVDVSLISRLESGERQSVSLDAASRTVPRQWRSSAEGGGMLRPLGRLSRREDGTGGGVLPLTTL